MCSQGNDKHTHPLCAHTRRDKHGKCGSRWCRRICFGGSTSEPSQAFSTIPLAVMPTMFLADFQTFSPIDAPSGFPISSRLVPPRNRVRYSPFVLSTKGSPAFPPHPHPVVNKREPFPMPSLHLRAARRPHPAPRGAFGTARAPLDILYMIIVYVCHVWNALFFPGVFLLSRVRLEPVL